MRTMTKLFQIITISALFAMLSSTAFAQRTSTGTYTVNGVTVNWRITYQFSSSYGRFCRRLYTPPIEGPNEELEPLEGEGEEPSDDGVVAEYRLIDFARDLMRGKYSNHHPDAVNSQEVDDLSLYSRSSVVEGAIGVYGMHLEEHPEDWIALREFAVALLEAKRTDEALVVLHEAYMKNPEMGMLPLPANFLGESQDPMRKLVVRAVQHAHRDPSGKAWLMVAVLMQSEGRFERSSEMLVRARDLGLDKSIVGGFSALRP